MKNLLLTLAACSVLLLIGCQENSITDPVLSSTVQKNQTSATLGTIPLDGILKVPGQFNSYYDLTGTIAYTEEVIQDPKVPAVQKTHVSVSLSVAADMFNSAPPYSKWNLSTITRDDLYIPDSGDEILVKHFYLDGRNDGLALVVQFRVTESSVKLESRYLAFEGKKGSESTNSISDIFTVPQVMSKNTYTQ